MTLLQEGDGGEPSDRRPEQEHAEGRLDPLAEERVLELQLLGDLVLGGCFLRQRAEVGRLPGQVVALDLSNAILAGNSIGGPEVGPDGRLSVAFAAQALAVPLPGNLAGASQDDPELTPLARCRYDFTLEVPPDTTAPRGLFSASREAGRWAVTRVKGDFQAVDRAWNLFFKSWLPASGLNLRAAPAEELYHQMPAEIGWDHFDLTLALPLET